MSNRQSVPRIRSVRFKSGGEVRLLREVDYRERDYLMRDARTVLEDQKDLAGYAIVAWGQDMSSTTTAFAGPRSRIPTMMVPEFVKSELLSYRIKRRAVETMDAHLGIISPDDDA